MPDGIPPWNSIDMAAYSTDISNWAFEKSRHPFGGQVVAKVPDLMSTIPSVDQSLLAGGNNGIAPLASRTKARSLIDGFSPSTTRGLLEHGVFIIGVFFSCDDEVEHNESPPGPTKRDLRAGWYTVPADEYIHVSLVVNCTRDNTHLGEVTATEAILVADTGSRGTYGGTLMGSFTNEGTVSGGGVVYVSDTGVTGDTRGL